MLTIEMIMRLNKEDRDFWISKLTAKDIKQMIKNWREDSDRKVVGYNSKLKKCELVKLIYDIIKYEEDKIYNDWLNNPNTIFYDKYGEEITKEQYLKNKAFEARLLKDEDKMDEEMLWFIKRSFEETDGFKIYTQEYLDYMNDKTDNYSIKFDMEKSKRIFKKFCRFAHEDTADGTNNNELFTYIKALWDDTKILEQKECKRVRLEDIEIDF